jgi:hypothetical protein
VSSFAAAANKLFGELLHVWRRSIGGGKLESPSTYHRAIHYLIHVSQPRRRCSLGEEAVTCVDVRVQTCESGRVPVSILTHSTMIKCLIGDDLSYRNSEAPP